MWRVRITIVAMETQKSVLCIVTLHITVNSIKIMNVAHKSFYGEFNRWQQ